MTKEDIKKLLLGEVGAGILLIIIQFILGIKTDGEFFYLLGYHIFLIAGVCSIIDGVRRFNKEKKTK